MEPEGNRVLKPCRCLLMESGQEEMSKTVNDLLALMPDEKKAGETARAKRLDVCRQCEHLLNGTCALCGCYVELRTAVKSQRCPDLPPRWEPEN